MDVEKVTEEILCVFSCVKVSEWEGVGVIIDKERTMFYRFFVVSMHLITCGPAYSKVWSNRDNNLFVSKALYTITHEPRRTRSLHFYKVFPRKKM